MIYERLILKWVIRRIRLHNLPHLFQAKLSLWRQFQLDIVSDDWTYLQASMKNFQISIHEKFEVVLV